MYAPVLHNTRPCIGCVFHEDPRCHIVQGLRLSNPARLSAVTLCHRALMERGIPKADCIEYNWRKVADHSTLED